MAIMAISTAYFNPVPIFKLISFTLNDSLKLIIKPNKKTIIVYSDTEDI